MPVRLSQTAPGGKCAQVQAVHGVAYGSSVRPPEPYGKSIVETRATMHSAADRKTGPCAPQ